MTPGPRADGAGGPWVPHPPPRPPTSPGAMSGRPNRRGVRPGPNSPGPDEPAGRSSGQGWWER